MIDRKPPSKAEEAKLRIFVNQLVNHDQMNATAAYQNCGLFNPKTKTAAANGGSRLMSNPFVQQYIQELTEEKKTRLSIENDDILREQYRIATSDIRNYLSWGPSGIAWKASDTITEDASRAIEQVDIRQDTFDGEDGTTTKLYIKIKMHSKIAALEMLAKHLGLYRPIEIDLNVKDEREAVISEAHDLLRQTRERLLASQEGIEEDAE
jgi:phage terminase small subunit